MVVRLTGGDLALLSRRLGVSRPSELKAAGVVALVREDVSGRPVWRPRLRFRTRPRRQCPFLVNDVGEDGAYRGLCSLHPDAKPLVCALSPLAREVETRTDSDAVSETWSFVPPVSSCPGVGQGTELEVAAPAALRRRLDGEIRWMKRLIEAGAGCSDEAAAWALLDSWGLEAPAS